MAILQQHTTFAGYKVARKLSTNHDGEREVYLVTDADENEAVLIVYNLKCERYRCARSSRKRVPDFIEEVKICSDLNTKCFPTVLARGIEKVGNTRFGWVAQKYVDGNSLADEIKLQGSISLPDSIEIIKQLATGLHELAQHCNGGGHYNLHPENIIVDYDGNDLKGVYIVGLTNVGVPYQGNPPFKDDHLSNLYRAPETVKGIYNQTSDIYSLGMMMLVMLLGDIFTETPEREPAEWNKVVWEYAGDRLSTATRLILQKATSLSAYTRIPIFAKLLNFLVMLEKKSLKTATFAEPTRDNTTPELVKKELRVTSGRSSVGTMTGISQAESGKGLDEVAGMADLKAVLRRNFVDIVKNRQMADMYGVTPPNGILLYGAPGCGKTFVAEKAAQESGLRYKIIRPSDLGSIYIHGSQGKIAEAFSEAEKHAPMILIFDEFDAIAPKREADSNNQANEVNEILVQLNNCAARGIYVLGTTNRPDMLDTACLRAGRIDEKIYVGLPDSEARKELFTMELKKRPCESNIDLELLCTATTDYTCSDISYIVKETARRCFDAAIRNGDGNAVPLTTEKLMEVAKSVIPSVSPKEIRLYQQLKEKMEYRDKNNRSSGKVGFSTYE